MSFFKPQVSFLLNFASPFSVMTHNSCEIFQLKHYSICFGQKEPINTQFFRLLSALTKVYPISYTIFETTRSEFIQFCITLQCHERRLPYFFFFFSSCLIYFGQKQPIEVKFRTFQWLGRLKFTKFLMSYFKSKVSFSLNFASLFNVMRNNSSVLFQLKIYMIFTTGAHPSAKFQTFGCSGKNSPNLYFDRLLLLKVCKTSAKKVQRSYVS